MEHMNTDEHPYRRTERFLSQEEILEENAKSYERGQSYEDAIFAYMDLANNTEDKTRKAHFTQKMFEMLRQDERMNGYRRYARSITLSE